MLSQPSEAAISQRFFFPLHLNTDKKHRGRKLANDRPVDTQLSVGMQNPDLPDSSPVISQEAIITKKEISLLS